MRIRPDDLEPGPSRWAGTVAAPERQPLTGIELPGPIAFGVEASRTDDGISLVGWLHAIPRLTCSRCLEPQSQVVRRNFSLRFVAAEDGAQGSDTELDESDLDTDYYPSEGLDLRPVLAEQVLLDLPMKPLCGEECLGLCPQCGTNLNIESCDCEAPVDPRLAALGEIRDQL